MWLLIRKPAAKQAASKSPDRELARRIADWRERTEIQREIRDLVGRINALNRRLETSEKAVDNSEEAAGRRR